MKILTNQEVTQWAKAKDVHLSIDPYEKSIVQTKCIEILFPGYPLRNAFLALKLVDLFIEEGVSKFNGGLLCITQAEIIGPPLETMGQKAVEMLTNFKSPDGTAGYLFESNEKMEAAILLFNTIVFAWDSVWIPENGEYCVFKSHDDVVYVMPKESSNLDYFYTKLSNGEFEVKKRDTPKSWR